MKQVTIKQIEEDHGLTAPEANGLIKSLLKLGLIEKIDKRKAQSKTGQGRSANVYAIPETISLTL